MQAAAGYLAQLDDLTDLTDRPFSFPARYRDALRMVRANIRTFATTSMGRLFDTAAALLGFTRAITFEGQAAMWLEQLARRQPPREAYPFPLSGGELDFRPLLQSVVRDRLAGCDPSKIARAFHRGIAAGLRDAVIYLCVQNGIDTVALSGGVFQNELLLSDLKGFLQGESVQIWTNHEVPSNDGGISLGQSALAAFAAAEPVQMERENDSRRVTARS